MENLFEEAPVCGKCVWARPTIGCKVIGLNKTEHYYTLGCLLDGDEPCTRMREASHADRDKDFNSSFHRPKNEKWRLR